MDRDAALRTYRDELLRWTVKINLIGPEARKNIDAHIDEAVAAAEILQPEGEVLDFGSGGGLPAIPMAIVCPNARFHLVESDQRKWAFLKHAVRLCALNSVVLGDRLQRALEKLDPEIRFSLVTSRAVGHPEEWVPLVREKLATDGRVALFERSPEPPRLAGFPLEAAHRLPRGEDNFLVILRFAG